MEIETALLRLEKAGIKINKNHRCDLTELITEIAGRDGLTPAKVLDDPRIQIILERREFNGPQKLARLKEVLFKRRYPTYTKVLAAFCEEIKKLKLDPKIKVTPTPFFENTKLKAEFAWRDPEELQDIIESLRRLLETNVVKNAFQAMHCLIASGELNSCLFVGE